MKEARRSLQKITFARIAQLSIFRILLWATAVLMILALVIIGTRYWRGGFATNTDDLYATIPFRPKVTYDSSNIIITNTEEEPYLDTSLNIYVGSVLYRVQIGTVNPGETKNCPLSSLTNEHGEVFNLGMPRASELEVRAHFRGYNDHKDFPPPLAAGLDNILPY